MVEVDTWESLYRAYQGILAILPEDYGGVIEPYPGYPLTRGQRGEDVRLLQNYLNLISDIYTEIPKIAVDGDFGPSTEAAVKAYQQIFGIPVTGVVGAGTWDSIANTYSSLKGEGNGQ